MKKMLMSDVPEKLIESVKKRPQLYSKMHPQFSDRRVKFKLWNDVASEVITNWADLSPGVRGESVCEVQRRWKTLRDGFSRELSFQRRDKQKLDRGEFVRKRKRYGWYNQLKFLLKVKQDTMDYETGDAGTDKSASDDDCYENFENVTVELDEDKDADKDDDRPISHFKSEPMPYYHVDVPAENRVEDSDVNNEDDEDKLFCLSLVPSFKKLTDKQKYDARIAVMQVLSDIRFKNDNPQS